MNNYEKWCKNNGISTLTQLFFKVWMINYSGHAVSDITSINGNIYDDLYHVFVLDLVKTVQTSLKRKEL